VPNSQSFRLSSAAACDLGYARDDPVAASATASLLGLVARVSRATVLVVTAGVAGSAWWVTGSAAALPVSILAVIILLAAIVDARIACLPNRAGATALAVVIGSFPIVANLDDRALAETVLSALAGVAYSGAPVLFLIWLVRPCSIGGGDWKMLGVLGAGIGLVLPFAALVMTFIACVIQIAASTILRRKVLPFGPAIAAGYAAALSLLPILNQALGGPYA
jgi:prepilin signal peptidase PulO-like enzyme (type II secretory pathway)